MSVCECVWTDDGVYLVSLFSILAEPIFHPMQTSRIYFRASSRNVGLSLSEARMRLPIFVFVVGVGVGFFASESKAEAESEPEQQLQQSRREGKGNYGVLYVEQAEAQAQRPWSTSWETKQRQLYETILTQVSTRSR